MKDISNVQLFTSDLERRCLPLENTMEKNSELLMYLISLLVI